MLIHGTFLLLDTLQNWPWHSWKCHRAFRGTRSRAKKLDPNLGDLNLRCKNCRVFSVAFGHQWNEKNWDAKNSIGFRTEMQQTFFDKKIPLGSHGPLWVMAAAALPSATFNHRSLGFRNPLRWSDFKGVAEARFRRDDLVQGFLDALEVPMDAIVALHDAMFSSFVLSKIWEICEG